MGTAERLRKAGRQNTLKDSPKGKRVPRPPKELSKEERSTFQGRFALHLQTLMDAAGKTKDDIAEATGLGEAAIRRWLRAEGAPDLHNLEKIAAALNLDDYRELLPPPAKRKR